MCGWSVGRSVGRLVGWLVGWLVGCGLSSSRISSDIGQDRSDVARVYSRDSPIRASCDQTDPTAASAAVPLQSENSPAI